MPSAGFNGQFLIAGSELDDWYKNSPRKCCDVRFEIYFLFKDTIVSSF